MESLDLGRRGFVGGALAAALLSEMRPESKLHADEKEGQGGRLKLYWGDLHNHNAVGYAKGSLIRSIDNAREHLDFFAFTGHASWHDMPIMPGARHMKWVNGFKAHATHWPKTRAMIEAANTDDFVSFLGYEWHSSHFGDYCMIFPEDQPDLFLPNDVEKLLDFAADKGALAIPHHVGYKKGWRGANFDHYRQVVSPVVEIFSEHGCTETDRAPFPMIRHSNGGRSTSNTILPQLKKGMKFGFVASSDNHRGYPGAYGEGVVGVWARDLSRKSLFEAIRARRTYAATGERILLEVSLNGRPMGSELPYTTDRQLDVHVEGQDSVHMIEIIRNGRVVHRHFPEDQATPVKLPGRAKCRIQYGWGPWAALNLGRTATWAMKIRLNDGKFLSTTPCFQSGPFEELMRDKLRIISENEIHLASYTSRVKCYAEDPTKSVVCEIEGKPDSVLSIELLKPVKQLVIAKLSELVEDNAVTFTGPFTSESYIIQRLVGASETNASVRWIERRTQGDTPDWYYVRVTQHNGHVAWSSPIWVG